MSANNYLRVKKKKGGYTVDECDADLEQPYAHVGTYRTLQEAVNRAKAREKDSFDEGYGIEYGIKFE
jgi:hypothetical protein